MALDAKEILNQASRMQLSVRNIKGLEARLRAIEASGGSGGTNDHALLIHRDFEHAGHTGFVPSTRKVAGKTLSNDIALVKGDVGLGDVDNTSDTDKPISTSTQVALDAKASLSGFARILNDGRIVRISDMELNWDGYAIGNWNGSSWIECIPSSTPGLANTDNDLDGNALTYDSNYHVYSQYYSSTHTDLVCKKWINDDTAAVVPQLWQGRYVYDLTVEGKKRLFLGMIRLRNYSGAKFTDSPTQGFISNYYNRTRRALTSIITGTSWTYNSATWRPVNNDVNNRIDMVLCRSTLLDVRARHNTFSSSGQNTNAETGIGVDSTSTNSASPWASSGWGSPTLVAAEAIYSDTLAAGCHYLCPLERSDESKTVTFTSYGKGAIIALFDN